VTQVTFDIFHWKRAQRHFSPQERHGTMKIIGLSIVRADSGIQDPIPIVMACDLSSYGFFQRQVSEKMRKTFSCVIRVDTAMVLRDSRAIPPC
jgi:hypothetical protein